MKRATALVGSLCIAIASSLATDARAVDGVLEISQTCAVTGGCFAGDTAGLPVTIAVSGSYRLTSNLTLPDENTGAVVFSANNIVLDLNGFSILGPSTNPSSPLIGTGIGIDGPSSDGSTVRNGTIQGVGSHGVTVGTRAHIEGVTTFLTGGVGIAALQGSIIANNVVKDSETNGIECTRAVVRDNDIMTSGTNGIYAAECLITGNMVFLGVGFGLARNGVGNTSGYKGNIIQAFVAGEVELVPSDLVNLGQNLCVTGGGATSTCP